MAQARYPTTFPVVEIQHTFYDPPAFALLDRWRGLGTPAFEITIKAWQVITHLGTSPTYRKIKRPLSPAERAEAGAFRDTAAVANAWQITLACAARLRASAILFQCPASFKPSLDSLRNLRRFFARIARPEGVALMLEPRGPAWTPSLGRSLCDELGLVHVVDPFVTPPVPRPGDPTRYFRLHGISGARHVYGDAELAELARLALEPVSDRTYVMFNNIPRVDDAQRFMRHLDAIA